MTSTQFSALVRRYTGTDSTTYSDAVMLVDANIAKDEIAQLIALRNESLFQATTTDDLVASSVTAREYALADDVLSHIFTVEAALDSTQSTVFTYVKPYPGGMQRLIRNLGGITEAKITNAFTNTEPYYVKTRRGVYLLSASITALSEGLKIRYRQWPADLASLAGSTDMAADPTTTSFGMPKNFHEIWARRVSIGRKSSRAVPIPLSVLEQRYEIDLSRALNSISKDDMGEEQFGSIPDGDSPSLLGAEV